VPTADLLQCPTEERLSFDHIGFQRPFLSETIWLPFSSNHHNYYREDLATSSANRGLGHAWSMTPVERLQREYELLREYERQTNQIQR